METFMLSLEMPAPKHGNWRLYVLSFPCLMLTLEKSHANLGKVFGTHLLLNCMLPCSGSCVICYFGNKNDL